MLVQAWPAIDGPSIEGFRCENRIVLAVHLLDRSQNELQLTLRGLDPRKVKTAVRVGVFNSQTPLSILPSNSGTSDGQILLRVPIPDPVKDEQEIIQPNHLHSFYVTVEMSE